MGEISFNADTNIALLGGQSMVFHCHFYNCALQKAVEQGLGERAPQLLEAASARTVRQQLEALAPADPMAAAARIFRELGFGVLELNALDGTKGTVTIAASHYAMGWTSVEGERPEPVCFFPAGFIRAAVSLAHGVSVEMIRVTETACFASGAPACRFSVEAI